MPAKAEYAVRAAVALAAGDGKLVKARTIAESQDIPLRFLLNILRELVVAGLVESHRGMDGGFRLAKREPAVTVADILRAVDHELTAPGRRHEASTFDDMVDRLREDVWTSLDRVTLAELAAEHRERAPVPG